MYNAMMYNNRLFNESRSVYFFDYIVVGDLPEYNFGTSQDFSLVAWVKTSSSRTRMIIVSKYTDGITPGWGLEIYNGKAKAWIRDGVGVGAAEYVEIVGSTDINDGEWHLIGATFDRDGLLHLTVDDSEDATAVSIATITDTISNTARVIIGARDGGTFDYFYGDIDNTMIFNEALALDIIIDGFWTGGHGTESLYLSKELAVIEEYIYAYLAELFIHSSESINIDEYIRGLLPILYLSISDSINVSDSPQLLIPILYSAVNDSIIVSEYNRPLITVLYLSIFETLSVSEYSSELLPILLTHVYDNILVDDEESELMLLIVKTSDSINVSENISEILPVLILRISDNIIVSEFIKINLPLFYLKTHDDINISESIYAYPTPLFIYIVFDDINVSDEEYEQRFAILYEFVNMTEELDFVNETEEYDFSKLT